MAAKKSEEKEREKCFEIHILSCLGFCEIQHSLRPAQRVALYCHSDLICFSGVSATKISQFIYIYIYIYIYIFYYFFFFGICTFSWKPNGALRYFWLRFKRFYSHIFLRWDDVVLSLVIVADQCICRKA